MHAAIKERIHEISYLMSAERYIKLLEAKPWVFEHAEEGDIAGYLGMMVDGYKVTLPEVVSYNIDADIRIIQI